MFPNQPQPTQQPTPQQTPAPLPTTYLDQIAPQAPKKLASFRGPKLIAIIAGVLVILVSILAVAVNVIATARQEPLERLAASLETTESIVSSAQPKLKNSQLRTLNSNLKIYLTNTNRDISKPLATLGVNMDKLSASVIAAESGDKINATLEDARLNAVYDRTYAREMSYQLDKIVALMKQLYASTSSKSLKEFLQSAYTNLEPTQESFSKFNAANG